MTTDIHIQRPLDKISAREWRTKYKELFNWDNYQLGIFDWVENGCGNAMVDAVAGSGKTSTITGIVAALPVTSKIQIIAFNRHIAQKLKYDSRIPQSRVTVSTAHSLGKALLTAYFYGGVFDPDERKYFRLSKDAVQQLIRERTDYDYLNQQAPEAAAVRYPVPPPPLTQSNEQAEILAKGLRRFIQDIAGFAQLTLTPLEQEALIDMLDHFGIEIPDGSGVLELGIKSAINVLNLGERLAAEQHSVDFGDMLWLPNKWNLTPAQKHFLIVDEAQDANAAMIGLYQRVAAQGARVILLGDERQAIFGFSGSDANSWQSLRSAFNPTELPLSVCYRCPSAHLKLARSIVPQIEDRPDAPEGVLEVLHPDRVLELAAPGDLILCRLTAPLIDLCLKLIIQGEHARLRGRDLGKQLVALVNMASGDNFYPSEFSQALADYCQPRIAALREQGEESEAENLSDRYLAIRTCFRSFGSECRTLEEFGERINDLFTDGDAAVILSSLHRAKGDEAERVFLIGTNFLPFVFKSKRGWQVKQEWNLVYVALTRAKTSLYLVPWARNEKDREKLPTYIKHPLGGMELPSSKSTELEEELEKSSQSAFALQPKPPAPVDAPVELLSVVAEMIAPQPDPPLPMPSLPTIEKLENPCVPTPSPLPEATAEAVALSQDEWLTHENLTDMAQTLAACDFEMLAELRDIWPAYALSAACKLLEPDTKARIKRWVLEQNSQSSTKAIAPTKQMELMRELS